MDDKVFKQLKKKFFYVPLAIGWFFVILACLLVFAVTRIQTIIDLENSLLKASTGPYFQADNYVYVVESKNMDPMAYYSQNYFSDEEIQSVIDYVTQKSNPSSSSYSFISNGRRYMCTSRSVWENGEIKTRHTVMECTKSFDFIRLMGVLLVCICLVGMLAIFLFFYYFSNKAIEPVRQSFLRQQELIANASHELKTPLTVARTNLELIASDPNSTVKDNEKWLSSAEYQIARMNTLILDMLELTRYDANKINSSRGEVLLNDVIEGMTLSFEAICYEKSIALEYVADDNIKIYASKTEIEKIVGILLDNAIKYTPQNGKISMTVTKSRRHATIAVTNTGVGIDKEKLQHIFDRFFKVDASHKETSNSFGLGLSIAKSIVDSLKGSIKCESEVDKFTKFTVELPLFNQDLAISLKSKVDSSRQHKNAKS